MYPTSFQNPNYSAKVGAGSSGRVREEDFSIDGRAWSYRDPHNQTLIDKQNVNREKGRFEVNQHSDTKTNALYDYSYGQARDAAKALGIGNVDKEKEVNQIVDYIQNGPKQTTEPAPVNKSKKKEPKAETPAAPAAPSQEVTEAKERINVYKTTDFGAYGPKNSTFAERSSEIYNPNEDFQVYGQSSVTSDGNQQAQAFAQSKLSDVKNKYNFRPTLA